ncbi:hypothetical protein [Brevundimonas sp. A19_0]|uniref:hypothetical protein n=1 Tax=Brevundimonas sp. A19_0 TaxID=2821087 RepID=UPI001ADB04A1|nr:hypothetical protein [Brevundimonas sp. A19_0]MBO9501157.1 hypothetical protein [Brevundimonas sp. A19_0]
MSRDKTLYLNLAPAGDLAGEEAIGDKADAIIQHRPYHDWSDLKRAGLDQDAINRIKSAGAELGEPASGPIVEPGSGGSGATPGGNLGKA